ncbi:MAG: hypothetical protein FJ399_23495 [Verrucomicrobia bacterium]|nr:hypothetical protein [Verrucomicrobiota bacterium]
MHHTAATATDERLPFGVARCFSPRWDYRKVLERGMKLRATGKIVANVDDLDRLQHNAAQGRSQTTGKVMAAKRCSLV